MAANKTVPTKQSVNSFIESIEDASRQTDAKNLTKFLTKVTGNKAVLWGTAIIGFGSHHYVYDSGREGDEPIVSFSPRKSGISIYGIGQSLHLMKMPLTALGKVSSEGGCIRTKRLEDVNLDNLEKLIRHALVIRS